MKHLDQRFAERLSRLKAEALENLLLRAIDPKLVCVVTIEDHVGTVLVKVNGVEVGKVEVLFKPDGSVTVRTSQLILEE